MAKPIQATFVTMPDPVKKRKRVALAAFKTKHGIGTLDAGTGFDPKDTRWLAIKIPAKRLDNGKPLEGMLIIEMIASFGRLLEEGGYTGDGRTERDAIIDLCKNREIPCDF